MSGCSELTSGSVVSQLVWSSDGYLYFVRPSFDDNVQHLWRERPGTDSSQSQVTILTFARCGDGKSAPTVRR